MNRLLFRRAALPSLGALVAGLLAAWLLLSGPALRLDHALGLYQAEGQPVFQWTGGRAVIPIRPGTGSTALHLTLGAEPWPNRPVPLPATISIGAQTVPLNLGPAPRRIAVLLPADQREVIISSPAGQPPGTYRFLGAQIFRAEAMPSGLPLRELGLIAITALLGALFTLVCAWLVQRGHGPVLFLTLLALAVRLYAIDQSPPGPHRDEVVSTVDAYFLLHTGRDHFGRFLPLASFEAYGDWISPLLTYLQIPAIALFGPDWRAARVIAALAGAAVVPAVYYAALGLADGSRKSENGRSEHQQVRTAEPQNCRTAEPNPAHPAILSPVPSGSPSDAHTPAAHLRVSLSSGLPISPSPRLPVSPSPRLPISPSPRLPVSPSPRLHVTASAAALTAALLPWSVFLSRVAIPPALAPAAYGLTLLAALLFVQTGTRRAGLWFAFAGGLALYAYPTLKLVAPLLVALGVLCAVAAHDWRAARTWFLPAALLALLWLPFATDLIFNPNGGARFDQIGLRANSLGEWLERWWTNYQIYVSPDLYFISGDTRKIIRGVPGYGAALWPTAPLVLVGAIALLIAAWRGPQRWAARLLIGAMLIAPLGASLTNTNPHVFRAAPVVPVYALLAGLGAGTIWMMVRRMMRPGDQETRRPEDQVQREQGGKENQRETVVMRRAALIDIHRSMVGGRRSAVGGRRPVVRGPWSVVRGLPPIILTTAFLLALAWSFGTYYRALLRDYPPPAALTWFYADTLPEAMQRVVAHADSYDEIWVDADSIGRPYIYLLAARAVPPAEAQRTLVVNRVPGAVNEVTAVGRYRFGDLSQANLPPNLPILEAIPERVGNFGYVLFDWQRGAQRILVVRGMTTERDPQTIEP